MGLAVGGILRVDGTITAGGQGPSAAGGTDSYTGGSVGTIYLTNSAAICGSVRSSSQQGIAGAMVSATGGYSTFTDARGCFVLLVPPDWSGSVSVTAAGYLTPASRTLAHVSAPQFGIDFAPEAVRRPAILFQNSGGILRLSWNTQSGPTYQVYSTPDCINWSAYGHTPARHRQPRHLELSHDQLARPFLPRADQELTLSEHLPSDQLLWPRDFSQRAQRSLLTRYPRSGEVIGRRLTSTTRWNPSNWSVRDAARSAPNFRSGSRVKRSAGSLPRTRECARFSDHKLFGMENNRQVWQLDSYV